MKRNPASKQRSNWEHVGDVDVVPGFAASHFARNVHDGQLRAIVNETPVGWHLSISHARLVKGQPEPGRYPSWDEIAHARDELLPDEYGFVMHLPVAEEYVAIHATTFHLHEYPERAPEPFLRHPRDLFTEEELVQMDKELRNLNKSPKGYLA